MSHNKQTIEAVRTHCERRGARLTPIREQVLEIVLKSKDLVKAYDVLNELQKTRGQTAPPTVYRALDFLVEVGVLHRTESLNGFVFCSNFQEEHKSIITNCKRCGATKEWVGNQEINALIAFCKAQQFFLSSAPVVVFGLCENCLNEEEEE